MTTSQAIEKAFNVSPETFAAIKNHQSPPEMLKMACLIVFPHIGDTADADLVNKLQNALWHLQMYGNFNEHA